jgi:hypothetical protein
MNTDTLIHNLALQCQPVKPIGHPVKRFLIWAISSLLLIAAGVFFFRPGPDFSVVSNPSFIFPAMAMLCVSLICTLSAFILSIPNKDTQRFNIVLIVVMAFWFGLMIYMFASTGLYDSRPGFLCIFRMTILAIAPAVILFYMLKRAAPMQSGLIGFLAALGSFAFAGLGLQFICHKSTLGAHVLVWHIIPLSVLALLGVAIGHWMFSWPEHRSR